MAAMPLCTAMPPGIFVIVNFQPSPILSPISHMLLSSLPAPPKNAGSAGSRLHYSAVSIASPASEAGAMPSLSHFDHPSLDFWTSD